MRVMLASMPWQYIHFPSIQIGLLKSYLSQHQIPADAHHFYMLLPKFIDATLCLEPKIDIPSEDKQIKMGIVASLLFPERQNQIKTYLKNINHPQFNSESLINQLIHSFKKYNEYILNRINWEKYDLVGFTIMYDQLFPSIYFTRLIKKRFPEIKVVFGGPQCKGELGTSILKTFPEIDFVVNGEGEETLKELCLAIKSKSIEFSHIGGLIWRKESQLIRNIEGSSEVDLNSLPFPDFSDYFSLLEECKKSDSTQNYQFKILLPIESSRGCNWNRCTFCNYALNSPKFRTKSVKNIRQELHHHLQNYNLKNFIFTDNVFRPNSGSLFKNLIQSKSNYEFHRIEIRANTTKDELKLMKRGGVKHIVIGIEAFSTELLQQLDKGTTCIQNIQIIKFCAELEISVGYNLMLNFPKEEKRHITQQLRVIKFIQSFPPPEIVFFRLQYGSPVYHQSQLFNIKQIQLENDIFKVLPPKILETIKTFQYDFNLKKPKTYDYNEIDTEIGKWLKNYSLNQNSLVYQHHSENLTIIDTRNPKHPYMYSLTDPERSIYLFCDSIKTLSQLEKKFNHIPSDEIQKIVDFFLQKKIMFREGNRLLSLAIQGSVDSDFLQSIE